MQLLVLVTRLTFLLSGIVPVVLVLRVERTDFDEVFLIADCY